MLLLLQIIKTQKLIFKTNPIYPLLFLTKQTKITKNPNSPQNQSPKQIKLQLFNLKIQFTSKI